MRILVCADFYPDSLGRNFAVTLRAMGHNVRTVEASRAHQCSSRYSKALWTLIPRAFPGIEARRHEALARAASEFDPDLVLLSTHSIPPEAVARIRKQSRAKIAVWFPDTLANLGRQYLLASDLDAWFFKDPYMVETFRAKLGLNAHYLPEACNSQWHRKVELTDGDRKKYGCDLTVACNLYYYRAKMLETFRDYDLKIWGPGGPRWLKSPLKNHCTGIYVAENEKAKAFNAAKIVLNTMHYSEIDSANARLFEAAGCGAFQIADWKSSLPALFEPGREIVTFYTLAELKEKVDFYLRHPEERQQIAGRALARAHREHTYEKRFQKMFEILGLASKPTANRKPALLQTL